MARIVIVDDHPSTREGLRARIELEPDLEVCGEAADLVEAMQMIERQRPDVAVIDVSLKSGNGIELIKRVKAKNLPVRMLVWSMYEESLYAERALRAGAMGFINKGNVTGVIIDAIRGILKGDIFLSDGMSAKLLQRVVLGKQAITATPESALSDRELETFALIGRGKNTMEIAKTMHLSPKTIETYRARIKEKLHLTDMAALAREATQWVLEHG